MVITTLMENRERASFLLLFYYFLVSVIFCFLYLLVTLVGSFAASLRRKRDMFTILPPSGKGSTPNQKQVIPF